MKPRPRSLAAGVCWLLASCVAAAQDARGLSLEQLLQTEVESASRYAQPLAEAPAAVSILTAEEIRRHGFRNLGEALQSVRGIHVSYERDYSYIGIRGFARPGDYNTRMLLLADGMRRNDPLYDTAAIGNEAPLDMDWIKRIEYVGGPASALYGANALFGVANAVLWSGADIEGGRVKAEIGSGGERRLSLLGGHRIGADSDWLLGVSTYGRNGENLKFDAFDIPGGSDGIAHRRDGERYLKALAKLNLGAWSVAATLATRNKDVPTAYYGTLFDRPGNFLEDRYAYLDVGHASGLARDWSQALRLRAGHYASSGEYVFAGYNNRDEATAAWWGGEYLLTWTGARDHRVVFGVDAQRNQRLTQRNFDLDPRVDYLNVKHGEDRIGVFVQDEWRIASRWMVNLGARADRVAGFSATSPRGALIFHPQPETAIKLIAGKAFRAPNAYERYYDDGQIFQKTNPSLGAERILTRELTIDHALRADVRVSAGYFHYRLKGLIEQVTDTDGLLVFVNRDDTHADGLEFETEWTSTAGLRVKGGLSRQRLVQENGLALNAPRVLGKLLIDGPIPGTAWTLGLGLHGVDRRESLGGTVGGHAVGHLHLRGPAPGLNGTWSLSVRNIADRRYFDPASAPVTGAVVRQDGRQLRLAWEIGF